MVLQERDRTVRRTGIRGEGTRSGSVSVELVGALPIVFVTVLIAAQIGVAGYALWSAGTASRAGARAVITGKQPRRAAERSLPPVLRRGLEVKGRDPVRIGVRIPKLLPLIPDTHVYASSSLGGR